MSEFPPAATLPNLTILDGVAPDQKVVSWIVNNWLALLQQRLEKKNLGDISELFVEEAWWRDVVALTWDFHTKSGLDAISKYLLDSTVNMTKLQSCKTGGLVPHLEEEYGMWFIQAGFTFETKYGAGKGILRLVNVAPMTWKAWTVSTQLEELKGQPALAHGAAVRLTNGAVNGVNGNAAAAATSTTEPQVVVVGAGQSGLATAAHLKNLGLSCIVVERGSSVANAWWERYDSVRTHTTHYGDHFPFLKYPTNWPSWQEKEHITRWMDYYAKIMGLEVQLNSTVTKADYDEAARKWTVHIEDKEGPRTLRTNHVVMALGMVGSKGAIPDIPGMDTFKGQAYSAANHKTAATIPDIDQKNVVIVGCATTAHDMAQDFVNHGAKSVAMIQRQPTWSFSAEAINTFHLGHFTVPGVSTEEADLLISSLPTAVARVFGYEMTQKMVKHDAELLDNLEKVGLAIKRGEDGTSFIDYLFFRGGHFYVDQGATPMILDGRIKIHMSSEGVKSFTPDAVVLAEDRKVDADIVVLATGFEPATAQLKQIMGEKIGAQAAMYGAFDSELERLGWWRPTGIPGFWYICGTLSWSRQYSGILALQIAAVERGFVDGYWDNKN